MTKLGRLSKVSPHAKVLILEACDPLLAEELGVRGNCTNFGSYYCLVVYEHFSELVEEKGRHGSSYQGRLGTTMRVEWYV